MSPEAISMNEGSLSPSPSAWREQFSLRLARAFTLVFVAVGAIVWRAVQGSSQRFVLLAVAGLCAMFCGAPALTGWPNGRRRAWFILVPTLASALAGFAMVGFIAGPAVVLSLTLMLSGLLLGLRPMLCLSAVAGLTVVLIASAMINGTLPGPQAIDVSVRAPLPWLRTMVVMFLATSLLGSILTELVDRLERSLLRAQSETERRERADRARGEAEIAALEAKQLETVGRLAAGVAHDFNNSLTAILGCAELLREVLPPNFPDGDLVDQIQQASQRAAELTRQLLAYSRKAQMVRVPTDLHLMIEGAVSLFRRSTDPRVEVVTRLQAGRAIVDADATLMQSSLLNLLVNARDAMPDGGVLTVATSTHELVRVPGHPLMDLPPGSYLLVEILDTGVGIEPEALSKVFDPFFTTKPVGKGTGLGLAAVAGTIRSHHGMITVDSEINSGTAFRILLPRIDGELQASREDASAVVRGTGRVLVIDDEAAVRQTVVTTLRVLGYDVTAASDGAQALDLVRQGPDRFDIALLDLQMPNLSGEATFDQLRILAPRLRVIIWSGYAAGQDLTGMLRRGAVGFIQKPYRVAELSRAIAEALRASSPLGA